MARVSELDNGKDKVGKKQELDSVVLATFILS